MVGLSHISFRRLLRNYLPQGAVTIWPTEMLSSWKLPSEDLARVPETLRDQDEQELVPQILGNEPNHIRLSVQKLVEWGASGIDINMGCPVKKALRHNYGVALMGDASYAADVVRMTVEGSSVPVSVKLRAGLQSDLDYLVRFVSGLAAAGASWVCLHPRQAEQKRRGTADWDQIRLLREAVSVPVIGNGDVQVVDDVFSMFERSQCDMVMIGRALTARPWLLWQVGERLGLEPPERFRGLSAPVGEEEEAQEYGRSLMLMAEYMLADFGEDLGLRKFRFYVRNGSAWLDFGQHLTTLMMRARTLSEAREALPAFFASRVLMRQRTDLR